MCWINNIILQGMSMLYYELTEKRTDINRDEELQL